MTEAAETDPLFALVLEDREEDFELIARELRKSGFTGRCVRVDTEEDYLAKIQLRPKVILSDYVLPGFGAMEALKLLQQAGLDIPFLVLTGAVREELVVQAVKSGAYDYLLKDRLARLEAAVAGAIEDAELRREKAKTEEEYRRCNLLFQRLVETANVIPWEFDRKTKRFTYAGPQAEALLGYPLEDWYGEGFWEAHVHPEDRGVLFHTDDRAVPGDHDFTCRVHTKDHKTIYLHCGVQTSDGEGRMANGFMVDITELKRTQLALASHIDALAASNADLRQFAYAASHDLQEPLRMVSFYTQLLAKRYRGKLDADADEFIGYAMDGATRMRDLIKDLLEYSRVGAHNAEFASADCETILSQSLANLDIAVRESSVVITRDPLPVIRANVTQLGQVFQNLVANAIKFRNADAPRIHVSAREEQQGWEFSVSDNGIGIDAEYFDTIFVIFQQLNGKEKYEGTGVGLALCRKIVEWHKGRIWVESEPGQGTTFHFTIPNRQGE